jgi:hypothetical protein
MLMFMKWTVLALIVALPATAADVTCRTGIRFPDHTSAVHVSFDSPENGVFLSVQVRGKALAFSLDTGSPYTLIDRTAAARIGIRGGEQSTIGGAGAGDVSVEIVRNMTIRIGAVTLTDVDLRLVDLSGVNWGRPLEGVIGFDLLCNAAVTVNYDAHALTITRPDAYRPPHGAEILPLEVRGGHSFVEGTIKVAGNEPVTDRFLIDSGSSDAVNHPVIMKSTGPLRSIQTGNGLGKPVPGALGPNEWFRIGHFTIPTTQSVCCGGYEEASRGIGGEILSRFVVTFDYPHQRLMLTRGKRAPGLL